jgi:hypothetical protein
MSKKVYRTAQGKTVDLGAIQLQNETVRAVGNMGVNARGDKLSPQNSTIDSRNASVNRHYKKQTRNNVTDDVVRDSKQDAKTKKSDTAQSTSVKVEVVKKPVPVVEDPVVEAPTLGGLADAIAKAKSIKQEPMKPPRQLAQEKAGVKKI